MTVYKLRCECGNEFEIGLPDEYDWEKYKGVCCPKCGGRTVVKTDEKKFVGGCGCRGCEND